MPALRLRRWRLIACAAAAELVLWSGAASVIGWENIWKYPSLLLSADANRNFEGIYPLEMICLRALLSAYLPHEIVMPLSVVAFFLALAAIYYAWLQLPMLNKAQVEDERVLPRWLLSLTIIAMILFSPHTHLYDQLLLFVPVALTFPPAKQTPAWPVWAFLCVAMPVESWFLYFSEGAQKFAVHHVLSMDYAMNMLVVNAFVCYRIRSGLI
jgi:hypothetical protein